MGKTLMDGTEQTIFENTDLGEYSGYIFLDKMLSGDTLRIRMFLKDLEDATYKKYLDEEYSDAQLCPIVRIMPIIGKVGFKVTAQQTVGAYRELTHMWFKR